MIPKLQEMLLLGEKHSILRQNYTVRSEEEIKELLLAMLAEVDDDITEYAKSLPYPKVTADMARMVIIDRTPMNIQQKLIERLDEILEPHELLLKFDMYMILCHALGDEIERQYAKRYSGHVSQMKSKMSKLINPTKEEDAE